MMKTLAQNVDGKRHLHTKCRFLKSDLTIQVPGMYVDRYGSKVQVPDYFVDPDRHYNYEKYIVKHI